ncbi:MAG: PEP-CTERM sorting domain-containing protein [Myxococcota bacterium]|nr:PEP-CTERM sorting domain-containing protein [Myxococcota bacterium]
MRKFSYLLAAALLVVAGSANAGPFAGGSLSITIGTLPGLAAPITGGFTTAGGNVTATSTNAIVGSDTFIGITNAAPITRVQAILAGNNLGTLVPGAGTAANALGIQGVANVVAYGGYVTLVAVPLTAAGVPGATFSFMGGGGSIIKFTGNGWTTGTAMITLPTATLKGMTQSGVITAAGTNNLVGGVGQITFISPVLIRTNLAGDLPTFAALTLTFVPEPGTLMLIGAGIAGLAVYGRRRASN